MYTHTYVMHLLGDACTKENVHAECASPTSMSGVSRKWYVPTVLRAGTKDHCWEGSQLYARVMSGGLSISHIQAAQVEPQELDTPHLKGREALAACKLGVSSFRGCKV